jgi:hypothetical protein
VSYDPLAGSGSGRNHGVHRATMRNQAVLSGLPTIDGALMGDGESLVLMGQTTGTQNGPWIVHPGAWTRPSWFAVGSSASGYLFEPTQGAQFTGCTLLVMNVPGLDVVGANDLTIRHIDGRQILTPPDPLAFSWGSDIGNPGLAIADSVIANLKGGEGLFTYNNHSHYKMRIREQAIPGGGGAWTHTIRLRTGYAEIDGGWHFGICARNSAVDKAVTVQTWTWDAPNHIQCGNWQINDGAADVQAVYNAEDSVMMERYWFRLIYDDVGFTLTYQVSLDGDYWFTALQHAADTWFLAGRVPDFIGYFSDPYGFGTANRHIICDSWEVLAGA